jgi:hypothetical protein
VSAAVVDFVHTMVAGIAGVVSVVFHAVTSAWDEFWQACRELEAGAFRFARAAYRRIDELLRYWIPHFAITAWWWVTHPSELASVLFWHLIRWAEVRAWTAGRYLGNFVLAVIVHQLRRVLWLAEHVLAAVL